MMPTIAAFLTGMLPWLFGAGVLYGLLYRPRSWHPGQHMVVIGASAYLGFLLLALVMHQLQSRNLAVFSDWLPAWGIAAVLVAWLIGDTGRRTRHEDQQFHRNPSDPHTQKPEPRWLIVGFVLWLSIQYGFVMLEVALRPLVSWDAVWYWARPVSEFIQWQLSDPVDGGVQIGRRHPTTIHLINIWSAYTGTFNAGESFTSKPWLALYTGILIAGIGFTWASTEKLTLGLGVGILLASSPVLVAQTALAGYADIWVAAGLFFSVVLTALHKVSWRPAYLAAWVTVTMSLIFLKSASISLAVLAVAAALAAYTLNKARVAWSIVAILTVAIAGAYFYFNGLQMNVGGQQISYSPANHRIRVGIYWGVLSFDGLGLAMRNIWMAFMMNTSYFFSLLVLIVGLMLALTRPKAWCQFGPAFGLLMATSLIAYVLLAQGFSEYFLEHSMPQKDTGLTRFSQGWFLICTLTISFICKTYDASRSAGPLLGYSSTRAYTESHRPEF